jgi:polysaccharide biosynthesis protein PslG
MRIMMRRYRVIIAIVVPIVAAIVVLDIFIAMPSSNSAADLPGASHSLGAPLVPVKTPPARPKTRFPRASYSLGAPEFTTRPLAPVKTPPAHPKARLYGISDPALLGQAASEQKSQLAAMKAIGINSIRVDANWAAVQPDGPSTFDWGQLDQTVNSILSAGMSADLIIDGCPLWAALPGASGDPAPAPASSAQYATFAAQVAARYAPAGVSIFEIWNEPNSAEFWQPAPNPQAYTAILKAAYAAIKKVVPSALVISGGLAPATTDGANISPLDFLQAMYADGVKGSFDALGFHPYTFPAAPDTYEPWSAWSQMDQTTPSVRSVMASNGDSGKKIWITEYGAPSSGPDGVGEAAQSASLTQAIDAARSTSWIGSIYLYTWVDSGNSPADRGDEYGLLTDGGEQKLAYHGVAAALKPVSS